MFTLERSTDALKCTVSTTVTTTAPIVIVNYMMHFGEDGSINHGVLSLPTSLASAATTTILPWPSHPSLVYVTLESLVLHNIDTASNTFSLIFTQSGVDYSFWNDTLLKDRALIIDKNGAFQYNPS